MSKKGCPRAFRQWGIVLSKNGDVHVAALTIRPIRVEAKKGLESVIAHLARVPYVYPACRLKPGKHPIEADLVNPCAICGATLRDVETKECVFCRQP